MTLIKILTATTGLTLPVGWTPALGRHPALRPQHGPSAHPRHTSRSIEPPGSFGKPQEDKPMDVTQRIQWKSESSKDIFATTGKLYELAVS